MAANGSPSGEAFNAVIRDAVTAVLKPAGFRKSSTNYHRRRGGCVQVVNVQGSHGSTWEEKRFYINVGLAFDEVCTLANLPILDKPKEYECDERGTRGRLETLVPDADAVWCAGLGIDPAVTTERLRAAMVELIGELDRIDGVAAYRSHRWFDRFRPKQENAQVLYILGDHTAARQEVDRLATLFADRQNASRVEWWIERLGLAELLPPPEIRREIPGAE